MNLTYGMIQESDLEILAPIMKRSFDSDADLYPGIEAGGPDGYDNGDFFRKWLFPQANAHGYYVKLEDLVVGAYIVYIHEHSHNYLGNMFLDPDVHSKGIGTKVWQHIEASYPQTKSWELGTPKFATRNHHFYEKCGFTKIREEDHDGMIEFIYKKEI